MSVCVVAANTGKANFLLAVDIYSPLDGSEDYADAQIRLRQPGLVSVGSGRYGKHSMAEVGRLRQTTDLGTVSPAALPKFVALLRAGISKQCQELLHGEVNEDLVINDNAVFRAHLSSLLQQRSGSIPSRIYRGLARSAAKPGKSPGFAQSKHAE